MKKQFCSFAGFAAVLFAAIFTFSLAGCTNAVDNDGTRQWWPIGRPSEQPDDKPHEQTGSISNISYSFYGSPWTKQADGRYKSPHIGDNQGTECEIFFTSSGYSAVLVIQLDVSSEQSDYVYISQVDDYSPYTAISGNDSNRIELPVYSPGRHSVLVAYVKDSYGSAGSDCAWFKILN